MPEAGSQADDEDSSGRVLSARLDNVRLLADALSCIYSPAKRSQDVVLSVPSLGGLKFAVEQHGCLRASVLLPRSTFAQFDCVDSDLCVRLNLSLFIDCLNIFAAPALDRAAPVPIRITYDGDGYPVVLKFAELDSVTVCKLNTIDNEYAQDTDFQFSSCPVINMALVQSEALRDAIAELHYGGATTAELRLAPTSPRFRFQSPASTMHVTFGDDGPTPESSSGNVDGQMQPDPQCAVELPDPEDPSVAVFSEFRSYRAQVSCYRLELLGRCAKALSMSDTSKLMMNEDGMLSILCRMRPGLASVSSAGADRKPMTNATSAHCFTEFIIVAEEICDDDLTTFTGAAVTRMKISEGLNHGN